MIEMSMNNFTRFVLIILAFFAFQNLLKAQPVADFIMSSTSGCDPMIVSFTNTSTGTTSGSTYNWVLGNGNNSTNQNPSATYTANNPPSSTTYSVTLTVTNPNNQSSTVTKTLTVYSKPTVSFTANPTSGCPPLTTSFSSSVSWNAPGGGTYAWGFGTGNQPVTTSNPTYTYTNSGDYTVTLIATSSVGCVSTAVVPNYIHVNSKPSGNFTVSPALPCKIPANATFTNTSTGNGPFTCTWNFGDGGTGSGTTASHSYNSTGNYTVTMVVTDNNGCKDTTTKSVNVSDLVAGFNSVSSVCAGAGVLFSQNTLPNVPSYHWDFGDGGTSNSATPSHSYSSAGTYTVTMVADNGGGCSDTAYKNITVNPRPGASFNYTPAYPCPAPTTVQFHNTTTGATSYQWNFGGLGNSTQSDPSFLFPDNGLFMIKLVATSGNGCKDSAFMNLFIDSLVMPIKVNKSGGCIPVTIDFSRDSTTYPYYQPITGVAWNFGDGTTSNQFNPSHTFTAYGTYTVTMTLTTANGCTKTYTKIIQAGTPPTVKFGAQPLVTCVKDYVQFNDSSQNVTDWIWYFGDGQSSLSQNPTHKYDLPGFYSVTLYALNNGCPDSLTKTNYIKVNYPKARLALSYSCDTIGRVNFVNNSEGFNSCHWDFGDGATSTTTGAVSHIYPGLGYYQLKMWVTNDTTGCTDTASATIHILSLQPSIFANDTTVCKDDTVHFTQTVAGGSPSRYHWFIDGGLVDSAAAIDHAFKTSGFHNVFLEIMDEHGCLDTCFKNNYILVGDPHALFIATPPIGCAPANVTFTYMGGNVPGTYIANYKWDLGIGSPVSTSNQSVSQTYPNVGSYTIKLKVTDNIGCTDSVEKLDFISVRKPLANFSAVNATSCVGTPVNFLNNSQGTNLVFTWRFGDGATSNAINGTHAYNNIGPYTVTLVIKDTAAGCMDSITKVNFVNIVNKPTAAFTASDTFKICAPLVVNFTNNSSGNNNYYWYFGDGGTSQFTSPSHIYNAGVNDVLLIATNQYGCKDTARGRVRILGYNGALTYAPLTGCAPLTVNFTAIEPNIPGFVFDFADGTTFPTTGHTATHTYTKAGPYVPRIVMTDNKGCSALSYGLDTIKVDGVLAGFTYSPYPACDKGTLTFLDTSHGSYSTVNSRLWLFHNGTTSTQINPSVTYPGPGTYSITMIHTTNTGCKDTLHTDVTFYPFPEIDAGPDTTICLTDSALLKPSGGVSYSWTPAATLSCANCNNPLASPTVKTTYTVEGTDIHGCKNTDTVTVSIKTKTTGAAYAKAEICESDTLHLHASGGQLYEWSPPYLVDDSHTPDPVAQLDTSVKFRVIVKEGSCIPDTVYVDVLVHPRPHVQASPHQTTMIAGNEVQLSTVGNSIIRYTWTPAENLSCDSCDDPVATPKSTTSYIVKAYTEFGCHDSDNVTITVICEQSQVYMPNTFTPNDDGQNDRFYPRGKGIRMIKSFKVFDRWGEVLFQQTNIGVNDMNIGWDGTYKGKLLSPDVYVYVMDGVCDTGEEFTWQGDISLIR